MVTRTSAWRDTVLGGDRGEVCLIKAFLGAGWQVTGFGAVNEAEAAATRERSLIAAIIAARSIVTPARGMSEDETLYAPHVDEPPRLSPRIVAGASTAGRRIPSTGWRGIGFEGPGRIGRGQ